MLHEYYTDTTKHCEKEVKNMNESFSFAKELIAEKDLKEVKIVTQHDIFFVRPPKVKKPINTPDKV